MRRALELRGCGGGIREVCVCLQIVMNQSNKQSISQSVNLSIYRSIHLTTNIRICCIYTYIYIYTHTYDLKPRKVSGLRTARPTRDWATASNLGKCGGIL